MNKVNPTKTIFWGWHSVDAISAVNKLLFEDFLEVVAWFGNAHCCTHDINTFLHQFDFIDGQIKSSNNQDLLKSEELVRFFDMYSRVSRSRGLTVQELENTAYCYYYFFFELIVCSKVEYVFFSSPPHFGVDYLLYLVAQKNGIQTVISYQSLVANRFFFVRRIDDFGYFQDVLLRIADESFIVERQHEKKLFYMNNSRRLISLRFLSFLNDCRKLIIGKSSKPLSFVGVIQKYQESHEFAKGVAESIHNQVDFTCKYVYFPLQLQPEMTTSALGGVFSDQLKAIECLSRIIPNNWYIYVKENPKQTHRQRGSTFYRRLKAIPNVKYVSKNISTYELIKNCSFVATITGTVGWEAITGGKNVLCFGFAWYRSLPGVVSYHCNLTIDEVMSTKIDHDKLTTSYNSLMCKTHLGIIDTDYSVIANHSDLNRNVENLGNFLHDAINGKLFVGALKN